MRLQDNIITEWAPQGSSVLELGCGNGDLLLKLVTEKKARAQGIEIDAQALRECVAKGLNVFQEDIDGGLAVFPDGAFDLVIMNECLQQVKKPDFVLKEALRVGRKAIVAFPNFAYYKVRFQVLFGKVPVTPSLPYQWYETPNLHFLSNSDFKGYCRKRGFKIERSAFTSAGRTVRFLPNLVSQLGIYEISV
ncbi:MAG: methionine biosynthesis protein MetW [Thaumarchaeota archaeon]|nr:methionine biosynthesis protein MetW [Nitrososphaerota archaeon]